jgi:hypothetical protein
MQGYAKGIRGGDREGLGSLEILLARSRVSGVWTRLRIKAISFPIELSKVSLLRQVGLDP